MQTPTHGGHAICQTSSDDKACRPATRQSPTRSASAALLTDEQAAREVLGVSLRKFADLMKEAWMPRPIMLGPRLRRWYRAELEAAIANMPRQEQPRGEPAQLRRQRIERMKAAPTAARAGA